ncbi:MAG TPA: sigma-54 dependent transcriptional regulator [Polyangia bacterium]|nr:sigma-54 dependent transcriptional regulator [Polyangia bacterium]
MLDILLVDDEPDFRMLVGDALRDAGHRITLASNGAEGLTLISSNVFDVMLCDIRLPKVDGLTLFRRVRQESPGTDVILITAHAAVSDAVAALKEGAYDYITKPFDIDEIIVQMDRIGAQRALKRELEQARAELSQRKSGSAIIGRSPPMLRLADRIDTIAQSDAPVLITGESGTGKELVARTLHERSSRRARPFIAVNCAAFPETLLEAELFGHERGAFTGAVKRRDGRFKAADGGTLLLDEIAEVPLPAQAKLLRVLQEGTVEPLGTNESTRVDVRIISATHRNLRERIKEGRFREDLYYRLNVLDIEIPPLRERRGDLPLLLQYFMARFTPAGKAPPAISPRAWAVLSQYAFPGNVREFAHAIEHAVVLSGGNEIDVEHLPGGIAGATDSNGNSSAGNLRSLGVALKEFEKEYLMRALTQASGKKMKAAEILGISRKNLWEKLRLHGIAAETDAED